MTFVHLTEHQVAQLVGQGCTASDWRLITISTGCDLVRISNVHFYGTVQIGSMAGSHVVDGVELLCGIYRASVSDCIIGDQVRIANIGSVISNYVIEDGVVIQDVASLVADLGATFGNGVELETINEAGGRGIKIINDLTSQTAYVQGMMRHNPEFSKRLAALMDSKAAADRVEREFYEDIYQFVRGTYEVKPKLEKGGVKTISEVALAVDLGGTNLRAAIVDREGALHHRKRVETPRTKKEVLDRMISLLSELKDEAGRNRWHVCGVGVSTGGRVDFESGEIVDSTTLSPQWQNVPLRDLL